MILSEADLEHWRTQGFVVARQVISPDQAARTADEIWEFAGRQAHANLKWHVPSRERQDSWYEKTADSRRGHVEMYHGKNQWENRTAPGVHEAFSQIHGTQRVTCSVDRACINPPSRIPDERLESLHWDRAQLYACNIEAHGQHVKAQPGHTNLWDARSVLTRPTFLSASRNRALTTTTARESFTSPTLPPTLPPSRSCLAFSTESKRGCRASRLRLFHPRKICWLSAQYQFLGALAIWYDTLPRVLSSYWLPILQLSYLPIIISSCSPGDLEFDVSS